MKVIVVHAAAGAGHKKAAEALYDYLKNSTSGIEVKLVDILEATNLFFRFSYKTGYTFLVRRASFLWYLAFWITYSRLLRRLARFIAVFTNRINARRFFGFLIKENPDCIISTHFLPAEIAARLKNSGRIKSRLITVVTDFVVHPYWISPGTDLYAVASEYTRDELIRQGIAPGCIRVTGIPIAEKFFRPQQRYSLRSKFGLEASRFTLLLMTGSFGIGPVEKIIRLLAEAAQLLVVCANNRRLYCRLSALKIEGLRIFAFVDNVHELMAAADMIITKPGGLTITEALARELVPVFIAAIPGQEAGNARVLNRYGIGFSPGHLRQLRSIVEEFKNNPARLEEAKQRIRDFRKTDTLRKIYDAIR
jgi:processive 1,2-diacylglycerol beta-glucosyltransferase